MIDALLQAGLSNACFAFLLAMCAMAVGAKAMHPQLTHLLWLLVLVKLITPPILNVPVEFPSATTQVNANIPVASNAAGPSSGRRFSAAADDVTAAAETARGTEIWVFMKSWLGRIWIVGTCLIVVGSLIRVRRFHNLLNQNLLAAPKHVQQVAEHFGGQLGMRRLPSLSIATAQISPMVWWIGGKVHVVLPQSMLERMQQDQWQWVVAHELAHVCRRDYLVRWLEWLACACFWWNPIVWWAQQNLRATEEACCDEFVLNRLNPGSHAYAKSILEVVESLACPVVRPPAMASEINSGGFLERRIEMVLSGISRKRPLGFLQFGLATIALLIIPLGIVQAQNIEAVKRRLSRAVKHNEITFEQAAIMMDALEEASQHHEGREEWPAEDDDERRAKYHGAEMELRELVEAGRITREQAAERLAGLKKHLWGDNDEGQEDERRQEYRRAELKIKEMVETGKMTREQAGERLEGLRKHLWGGTDEKNGDERRLKYRQAEMKIREMVEAGKMTREQAGEKLESLKERLRVNKEDDERRNAWRQAELAWGQAKDDDERKNQFRRAANEIEEAVEAGKITREQASERLEGLKKHLWGQDTEERGHEDGREDWDSVEERIEGAVKNGDMTREEADAVYRELKQQRETPHDDHSEGDHSEGDHSEGDHSEGDHSEGDPRVD